MGEAKRRKLLDPNWGRSVDKLLDETLAKAMQVAKEKGCAILVRVDKAWFIMGSTERRAKEYFNAKNITNASEVGSIVILEETFNIKQAMYHYMRLLEADPFFLYYAATINRWCVCLHLDADTAESISLHIEEPSAQYGLSQCVACWEVIKDKLDWADSRSWFKQVYLPTLVDNFAYPEDAEPEPVKAEEHDDSSLTELSPA